jgi:transposase
MDAMEQLKEDVRQGRIDANRLLDLLVISQRELQAAKQRIADLEKQAAGATTAKVDEPFFMKAEEKRQEARGRKKRKSKSKKQRGRLTTAEKVAQAVTVHGFSTLAT